MVTFALDGTPYRIEAKWPPFKLSDATVLLTRAQALEFVRGKLSELANESIGVSNVAVSLTYQAGPSGAYEPIVSVWAFPGTDSGSPVLFRYSLVSGPIPDAKDTPGDPPTDS